MNHGSLFSGIGGFDLAAEWMGWHNVFHCEKDPFCQKVLKYYWPNAIHYGDIDDTDFTIHRGRVNVLTGGFPCQPYSHAGKRQGNKDDRHKWPEMRRTAREIQPDWIIPENVRGLINWAKGLVFDEVQADMEAEGYEIIPFLLPACAVDAPHRRDRIWLIAHANKNGRSGKDTGGDASQGQREGIRQPDQVELLEEPVNPRKLSADTAGERRLQSEQNNEPELGHENGKAGIITDTGSAGPQKHYATQITDRPRFDSRFTPPSWGDFPTQSPVCIRDDGFPAGLDGLTFPNWRNESVKAAGNAIVPQVAFQIFKAIEAYEKIFIK